MRSNARRDDSTRFTSAPCVMSSLMTSNTRSQGGSSTAGHESQHEAAHEEVATPSTHYSSAGKVPAPHAEHAAPSGSSASDRAYHDAGAHGALATADAFYAAFAARDSATMSSLYAPNVRFHDPLFGNLHGNQVMAMWNAISPAANPYHVKPSAASNPKDLGGGRYQVHVTWEANYGIYGRAIHNHSETTLVIENGKIVEQRDAWDLHAWAAQALPGHLGGHKVGDMLLAAAAHSYIGVLDLIRRLSHS